MELASFRLLVGDFPAAVKFWRDVIGLSMSYGDEKMGYAYFDTGSVGLELFNRDGHAAALGETTPTPKPVGHQAVITFSVDDVDATYAKLVERGATAVAGPKDRPDWRARTAQFSDPAGYIFELYSPLREADAPSA